MAIYLSLAMATLIICARPAFWYAHTRLLRDVQTKDLNRLGFLETTEYPGCFYIYQVVGIGCAAARVRNSRRVM